MERRNSCADSFLSRLPPLSSIEGQFKEDFGREATLLDGNRNKRRSNPNTLENLPLTAAPKCGVLEAI